MSIKSEKLKNLLKFKKKLENKIIQLESELKDLRLTLEILNLIIIEKSFKHIEIKPKNPDLNQIEIPKKTSKSLEKFEASIYQSEKDENVIPLKTKTGESLAIIHIQKKVMYVLPDETKKFDVKTPPFHSFLVNKVLMKMKQKDEELVTNRVLSPEDSLTFEIITEGDQLREIIIKNVDFDRLKELKSSIRWTLEKMYEKIKK